MDDRTLYLILEINYFKMFGRQITLNPKENSDLLPKEWDLISNYELKSKILSEAIKNIEEERLPRISLSIEEKTNKINDFYDVEWQQNVGEQKYDIQSLKKTAERIAESYSNIIKGIIKRV